MTRLKNARPPKVCFRYDPPLASSKTLVPGGDDDDEEAAVEDDDDVAMVVFLSALFREIFVLFDFFSFARLLFCFYFYLFLSCVYRNC